MLFSVTAQDVELTVQDVELKGNPVYVKAFFHWRFFNKNTYLK